MVKLSFGLSQMLVSVDNVVPVFTLFVIVRKHVINFINNSVKSAIFLFNNGIRPFLNLRNNNINSLVLIFIRRDLMIIMILPVSPMHKPLLQMSIKGRILVINPSLEVFLLYVVGLLLVVVAIVVLVLLFVPPLNLSPTILFKVKEKLTMALLSHLSLLLVLETNLFTKLMTG